MGDEEGRGRVEGREWGLGSGKKRRVGEWTIEKRGEDKRRKEGV